MNPDTGKFHSAMLKELYKDQVDKITKPLLGEDAPEAGLKKGDPIPADWPMFKIGEVFPLKGHNFKLERIEDNCLVLRFAGLTRNEKRRREQK